MIKSDFHVHTSFSTDSDTPAREQIEALINKGITEICITDHHDIGYTAMEKADVNTSESTNTNIESRPFRINPFAYYEAILGLIPEYSDRARISIGVELGLRTDYHHSIEDFAEVCAWDIVRYAPNQRENYSILDYKDIIDEILKLLIQNGKGIECNTAGFKYGLGVPNPENYVLKRYHELGGEILTIGSDGHKPEHTAYAFDKVPAILESCGIRYYTVFHNRKPIMLPL